MEDYSSNSHKSKAESGNIPSTSKTVAKSTGIKKRSEFQKFVDMFIREDAKSIKEYIIKECFVPSVIDWIKNTVDFMFGSQDYKYSKSEPTNSRYRNYNEMSGSKSRRSSDSYRRSAYNYEIPTFSSKREAESVLEKLDELIDVNDVVSIMDLLVASGVPCESNYTYEDYGWNDIRSAEIAHCREGWYIRLPRPMSLSRR